MADIRPFKGTRYNPNKINDLAQVICPPYDIISSEQQEELYKKSEYNFVRIEFNRETLQDTAFDNRYTRAANNIENWLKQGILQKDSEPAFYIHEHYFSCLGKRYTRKNIIALVKLEEWATGIIRPHENIIPKAKSDRMSMLRACQSNTSTVLSMYADPDNAVSDLLNNEEKNRAIIDVVESNNEKHLVWALTNTNVISKVQNILSEQPLYIADGHHRYDSALTYRNERVSKGNINTGNEGYNYVLMNLFNFTDPGLVILPTHRLLKGVSNKIIGNLKSQLLEFFDIEEVRISNSKIWEYVDSKFCGLNRFSKQVKLALYGLEADKLMILTLKSVNNINQYMPSGHSDIYKLLDVSLVDHIILEKILGFVKDSDNMILDYTHDRMEAINQVNNKHFQLAFILGPVDPESIKLIADNGDRMPRKSTYFYPKAPAGLVFYRW
jgi:uncharacterized protein (DUF1015 family)